MNKYTIITLENNDKYAVIDVLKYNEKRYLLVSKIENEVVDNELIICEYSEVSNCFKEVEKTEELEIIFGERLNSKKRVLSYFDEIKNEMIKLQVIDKNSDLYLLKDKNNNLRKKTILLINETIDINDYIYLSEPIINEDNIFTYGDIYNFNNIAKEEIMIIDKKDNSIILQRYYG